MNLGHITHKLLQLMESQTQEWDDPILSGNTTDCEVIIARSQQKEVQAFAQLHGFVNINALLDLIEQRTSAHWVYMRGLGWFSEVKQ